MPTPPYLPQTRNPDWAERNWKWLVPAAVLVLGLFIFAIVALVESLMKSSDAYVGALDRARASPAVGRALGAPVEAGYFVMGNIRLTNSSGFANLTIPVAGPKDAATLYVEATKAQGEWHFDVLVVRVERTGQRIDLSERGK
jgi:hypothetical protein